MGLDGDGVCSLDIVEAIEVVQRCHWFTNQWWLQRQVHGCLVRPLCSCFLPNQQNGLEAEGQNNVDRGAVAARTFWGGPGGLSPHPPTPTHKGDNCALSAHCMGTAVLRARVLLEPISRTH